MRVEVERIVVHPGYNSPTLHENDIALIKVKSGGGELCTKDKVRVRLAGLAGLAVQS